MRISTTRFGTVDVPDTSVIRLPRGIIGLGHLTQFARLEHDHAGWFQWWQAVEYPETALMTVDPEQLIRGYDLTGADEELRSLGATPSNRIVAALMSLPEGTVESASVNLLAPIVINRATREGRQIILPEGRYPMDFRLASTAAGQDAQPMAA